jgi:LDH2 family malate/lactate/ureidoglycolate dehydrogenase
MARYVRGLRSSAAADGRKVMTPGEREWHVAALRARTGIPLDPETRAAFARLSKTYGVSPPRPATPVPPSPRKPPRKKE